MKKRIKDYSKFLGAKLYQFKDGNLEVIRIVSFVNTENARIMSKDGSTRKIGYEELFDNYNMLEPDGFVIFSIVNITDDIQDVIVSHHVNDGQINDEPYAICRQNIVDYHASLLNANNLNVGCCMSRKTTPEGVDFMAMRACRDLSMFTYISIYKDDKLEDILQCVSKLNKYDNVLQNLYDSNTSRLPNEYLKQEASKLDSCGGYCKTVKLLLENNDFMYDFRQSFGIEELVDTDIEAESTLMEGLYVPTGELAEKIQKLFGFYIGAAWMISYDRDVNLSEVHKDYKLISDTHGNIYIIFYDEGNKYIEQMIENESKLSPVDKLKVIYNSTTE